MRARPPEPLARWLRSHRAISHSQLPVPPRPLATETRPFGKTCCRHGSHGGSPSTLRGFLRMEGEAPPEPFCSDWRARLRPSRWQYGSAHTGPSHIPNYRCRPSRLPRKRGRSGKPVAGTARTEARPPRCAVSSEWRARLRPSRWHVGSAHTGPSHIPNSPFGLAATKRPRRREGQRVLNSAIRSVSYFKTTLSIHTAFVLNEPKWKPSLARESLALGVNVITKC